MSTRRYAKKQTPEEDFEAHVRETLNEISTNVTDIKINQDKLFKEINSLKDRISLNDKAIAALQNINSSMQEKYDRINGEIFDANKSLDDLKNDVATIKEKSLAKMVEDANTIYEKCLVRKIFSWFLPKVL